METETVDGRRSVGKKRDGNRREDRKVRRAKSARHWISALYEVKSNAVAYKVNPKTGIKEAEHQGGNVKFFVWKCRGRWFCFQDAGRASLRQFVEIAEIFPFLKSVFRSVVQPLFYFFHFQILSWSFLRCFVSFLIKNKMKPPRACLVSDFFSNWKHPLFYVCIRSKSAENQRVSIAIKVDLVWREKVACWRNF